MRKLSMMMTALFCVGTVGMVWADAVSGNSSGNGNRPPVPPAEKQQIGGNTGNNEDGDGVHLTNTHEGGKPVNQKTNSLNSKGGDVSLNPQPLPPKEGVNGDGKTGTGVHFKKAQLHTRKAGGDSSLGKQVGGGTLSPRDAKQISGNLNGNTRSVNGDGKLSKGFIKGEAGFDKHSSLGKGQATGGGGSGKAGFQDVHKGNGTQKVLIGLNKPNSLEKANGLKKASGFQKANGLQKTNGFSKAGMGDGSALPAVQTAH